MILGYLYYVITSPVLLFGVESITALAKLYFLAFLTKKAFQSRIFPKPLYYLVGLLCGSCIGDIAWLVKLLQEGLYTAIDYPMVMFIVRIAWACNLFQFQALYLFFENLVNRNYKISFYQMILLAVNTCISAGFLYLAFFQYNIPQYPRPEWEFAIMRYSAFCVIFLVMIPMTYSVIQKLSSPNLPRLLRKQLIVLIKYLIGPYLVTEITQALIVSLSFGKVHVYIATSTGSLLFIGAVYYAIRKVMRLRFLNMSKEVHAAVPESFMRNFRRFLLQLNKATTFPELELHVQQFFKDFFAIAPHHTAIYIRKEGMYQYHEQLEKYYMNQYRALYVEHKLTGETSQLYTQVLQEQQIVLYDELVFNNFYHEDEATTELIAFLEQLNAHVFLPIYYQDQLTAYVIIDREARTQACFSDVDRDEMLVCATYVGHLLYLLQHRNLGNLLAQEKELRDELYSKHQEVNQYKECIRSFLKAGHRKIGIIFYRSKRFTLVNQAAQDLLDVDLNEEIGHPTSKICRQIIEQVLAYKESKAMFAHDPHGNQILLSGMLGIETNSVLITVCYPDISDMLKKQIDLLQDPSEWDYVLYLETTKSGKLINQLIPSSGPQFLNFKIALLKAALSNKAILLDAPEPDLLPTVELIHYVSLKDVLHVLTLKTTSKADDIALQIFGTHPLFADTNQPSMLEKLNGVGTLFIQNIHLLDMKLQDKLAEFIKYGYYTPTKSDQYKTSTVRIICSTQHSLQALVHEGTFSKILYHELQKTTLTMPSLLHISSEEFSALADGLVHQAASSSVLTTELNTKDKEYLLNRRPESLYDYKEKVRTMLIAKSKKQYSEEELTINPAYNVSDPSLVDARRLGKKALKNPKMMELLWRKFKSQNQIAEFLGVHRASISRYCKKYNLAVKTPASKSS